MTNYGKTASQTRIKPVLFRIFFFFFLPNFSEVENEVLSLSLKFVLSRKIDNKSFVTDCKSLTQSVPEDKRDEA